MKAEKRLGRGLDSLISKTTAITIDIEQTDTSIDKGYRTASGRSESVGNVALKPPPPADTAGSVSDAMVALNGGNGGRPHAARPEARMVRLDAVAPNPRQPRRAISDASVRALADSIRSSGLIQPITVRPRDGSTSSPTVGSTSSPTVGSTGKTPSESASAGGAGGTISATLVPEYELVAGERRWRAARLAGLREVPVIVRDVSDEEMLEIALVENIQREDLNPIDRARAYRQYCERFRRPIDHVARRLGEDRSTVSNFLRLLELPDEVQDFIATGAISAGHARGLLALEEAKHQLHMANLIIEKGFSVREVEQVVKAFKSGGPGAKLDPRAARPGSERERPKSPHLRDMETKLERACGTRVSIQESRRKGQGKIVIEYYSLDDFDRIAGKLGVKTD